MDMNAVDSLKLHIVAVYWSQSIDNHFCGWTDSPVLFIMTQDTLCNNHRETFKETSFIIQKSWKAQSAELGQVERAKSMWA